LRSLRAGAVGRQRHRARPDRFLIVAFCNIQLCDDRGQADYAQRQEVSRAAPHFTSPLRTTLLISLPGRQCAQEKKRNTAPPVQ
jgi:hypothetical protein